MVRHHVLLVLVFVAACDARGPRPAAAIELQDLKGQRVAPLAAPGGAPIVLLFTRSDCPVSNRYAPEIARLYDELHPSGVAFWLVFVDRDEPALAIEKHVADFRYPCPALRDPAHALVKLAGARVTPEAAVFVSGRLAYRGRIDDWYESPGRSRAAPTTHDLEDAVRDLLAGRAVARPSIDAVGCVIADLE
ncbi:MAG: redoxin domain-containing protein [Acidobacteriota bacterium]